MNFDNLNSQDWPQFIYLVLLLIALSGNIIFKSQLKASKLVKQALGWLVIVLLILVAYSFKYDLINVKNRVLAQIFPAQAVKINARQIALTIANDGHFYIDLTINNLPVRFMVDTGASDMVISPNEAKRLGFNISQLAFDRQYQTANGIVFGASILLREVKLADLTLYNIPASVNNAPMGVSLLGMSFLQQFKKYEFYQDRLILTH